MSPGIVGSFGIGVSGIGTETSAPGVGGDPFGDFTIGLSPIGFVTTISGPQTDIRTVWDIQNGRGDWQLSGADLLAGDDLATSVLLSLFSDRLANDEDEIPDNSGDRRGWWGDAGQDRLIGSRLWLLERAKLTKDTARQAQEYAQEGLDWLIADKVVVRVDVAARVISTVPGKLVLAVVLYKTDGTRKALNFVWVWNGIN